MGGGRRFGGVAEKEIFWGRKKQIAQVIQTKSLTNAPIGAWK